MRISVSLPDDLGQLVRDEARRQDVSLSAVIRHALETSLGGLPGARLPWQGIVSGCGSAARNVDAVLADEWTDRIAGDRGDRAVDDLGE